LSTVWRHRLSMHWGWMQCKLNNPVNVAKYSGKTFPLMVFPWATQTQTEWTASCYEVLHNSSPLVKLTMKCVHLFSQLKCIHLVTVVLTNNGLFLLDVLHPDEWMARVYKIYLLLLCALLYHIVIRYNVYYLYQSNKNYVLAAAIGLWQTDKSSIANFQNWQQWECYLTLC